jgi:hypothetical protein
MSDATRTICVEVSPTVYALLEVLTRGDMASSLTVEGIVAELIDHAQQGVYRPGAWERGWLEQAFGFDWQAFLEVGDPYGRADCPYFQRPRSQNSEKGGL